MLDDLAIDLLRLGEPSMVLGAYLLGVIAGVAGIATDRSMTELERAPYFAWTAAVAFLLNGAGLIWGLTNAAVAGGYLWVIAALSIAVTLGGGFATGRLASARSRDAFGHAWGGLLALVPFANLWLLLKRSRLAVSAHRPPSAALLSGWAGVVAGLLLLAGGQVVDKLSTKFVERQATVDANDPASQRTAIKVGIRLEGLEAFLKQAAADTGLPVDIDELTRLTRLEAVGPRLVRTFSLDIDSGAISADLERQVKLDDCAAVGLSEMMRQGATIVDVYVDRAGREVGTVTVDRLDCVAEPAA